MQIGAWKNFDDLEKSLTLDELKELQVGYVERISHTNISTGMSAPTNGSRKPKDIVANPIKSGKDSFGPGSGLGHKHI